MAAVLFMLAPSVLTRPTPGRRARASLRVTPYCRRPSWRDIREQRCNELRKYSLAVPRHLWDVRMRRKGVYRSVEYVVEKLSLDDREIDSTTAVHASRRHEVVASVRPLNRLLPRFERSWPVEVTLGDAVLWTYKQDLIRCTLVTVAMSVSLVAFGFVGPTVLGIYSIPTVSMEPSLHVGDALLVEKVSLRATPPRKGEIVLFTAPSRLRDIVMSSVQREPSSRIPHRNDLFVKRVVALPGDVIEVRVSGVFVNGGKVDDSVPNCPEVAPRRIPDGFVFVVGDNASHSVDSRYWGLLPVDCVVGRPVACIFPPERLHILKK